MTTQAYTWTRARYDEFSEMYFKELHRDGKPVGEIKRQYDGREWYGYCWSCNREICEVDCRSTQKAYLEHCKGCTGSVKPEYEARIAKPGERILSATRYNIRRQYVVLQDGRRAGDIEIATVGRNKCWFVATDISTGMEITDSGWIEAAPLDGLTLWMQSFRRSSLAA